MDKKTLKKFDCVIIAAAHSDVDYDFMAKNAKIILDTRNVFSKLGIKSRNIVKL